MYKDEGKILNIILYGLIFILVVLIVVYKGIEIGDSDILAFIGSIIGGIIALVGVFYTIKSSFQSLEFTLKKQDRDKFVETIGIKMNHFYRVRGMVHKAYLNIDLRNQIVQSLPNMEPQEIDNAINPFFEHLTLNKYTLLEDAASIDWEFYDVIKQFVDTTNPLTYKYDKTSIATLTNLIKDLIKKIDVHEKRLSDKFKEASKNENSE